MSPLVLCSVLATLMLAVVTGDETLETSILMDKFEGDHIAQIFGNILTQLEETAFSMPDLRIRRHSGNKKAERLCCDFPNVSNKRDVRACHKEFVINVNVTKESTPEQNQRASQCFMECVARRKGWVDAEGELDLTAVNSSLQAGNLSAEWRQVQARAAVKCFQERQHKESSGPAKTETSCNSGAQKLMYCIFEYTFLNCPKDSWHETERCRAALSLVAAMSERRSTPLDGEIIQSE